MSFWLSSSVISPTNLPSLSALLAMCSYPSGRVVVVVGVARRVAAPEHGDLLPVQPEVGEGVVQPGVPVGARSLLLGVRVPRGSSHDDRVEALDLVLRGVVEVLGLESGGLGDVPRDGLGVPGLGLVVEAGGVQGGGLPGGAVQGGAEGGGGGGGGGDDGELHVGNDFECG